MQLRKITILLLFIILQSCEEKFNWPLQEGSTDLIVVEAVMTNENKNHLIKLSKTYQEQNEQPEPVTGATVVINTRNGLIPTIEYPGGSGMYYTDSIRFVSNVEYALNITYNGQTFFATANQPGVEPLPAKKRTYYMVDDKTFTLAYPESGQDPSYTSYYVYWKHLGDCPGDTDCQAAVIHYDLKNIDVNEQFKPDQEQIFFPAGTIILRKKYSVSDEYKEYLRGVLSETAWRGGAFDSFPANASSNLSEGAVGFFAISAVISDTLLVRP